MNLVGTLAKVAMGVMVAKGVGKMMGGGSGNSSSGGGLGGLLGSLAGAATGGGGAGGLGGMLGSVLSGGGQSGGGQSGGGLGGLLNSLGGGNQGGAAAGGGLGDLLNSALGGQSTPEPTQAQNSEAELLLRAMINAAKADGNVDEAEQRKIVDHIGDVSEEEVQFIRNEMSQPIDMNSFVRSVPKGMEAQVYVMSLLGIDLDSQAEAQYLDKLASAMGISHDMSNQIHAKVGVPALYS